ncbi:MAG: 7-cyano-7-deazaguanine synthase [Acidobacteria bacterium]|nr:7-cyano-7-deazaguanine synthase [Acidobacteriota bacterium]MYJ04651.1 7-cyano-7-deazaguanine synthase [Acidobacteriota bacterium]
MADRNGGVAVLCSGGLDSAVLLAHELDGAEDGRPVHPVYVSGGLAWEEAERRLVERLLDAPPFAGRAAPLASLDCPVDDTYPETHWALRGTPPAYATADEEVYLVGRNVLLLAKAATWCALHGVERVAVGPLAGNPFPDATPAFFAAMGDALTRGLDHPIRIAAPFATFHKEEVIARGAALGVPFELTLSCMNPSEGTHCGRCSKCRERLQAFDEAGVDDPAPYAWRPANLLTGG